jgi:hypothetical protein
VIPYVLKENIEECVITPLTVDGNIHVKVKIRARGTPKIERKIFETNDILEYIRWKGYNVESVLSGSSSIRNFTNAEKERTGFWVFKLKMEEEPVVVEEKIKIKKHGRAKEVISTSESEPINIEEQDE